MRRKRYSRCRRFQISDFRFERRQLLTYSKIQPHNHPTTRTFAPFAAWREKSQGVAGPAQAGAVCGRRVSRATQAFGPGPRRRLGFGPRASSPQHLGSGPPSSSRQQARPGARASLPQHIGMMLSTPKHQGTKKFGTPSVMSLQLSRKPSKFGGRASPPSLAGICESYGGPYVASKIRSAKYGLASPCLGSGGPSPSKAVIDHGFPRIFGTGRCFCHFNHGCTPMHDDRSARRATARLRAGRYAPWSRPIRLAVQTGRHSTRINRVSRGSTMLQ